MKNRKWCENLGDARRRNWSGRGEASDETCSRAPGRSSAMDETLSREPDESGGPNHWTAQSRLRINTAWWWREKQVRCTRAALKSPREKPNKINRFIFLQCWDKLEQWRPWFSAGTVPQGSSEQLKEQFWENVPGHFWPNEWFECSHLTCSATL